MCESVQDRPALEITPAMIEAGVSAHSEFIGEVSSAFLVREVYQAMAAAEASRRTAV